MLTHLQRNISDKIPPLFKTIGALALISIGLGFYPVCRRGYTGPSSSPGLFWKKQNRETAVAPAPLQAAVLVEMGNSGNQLRHLDT